MRLLLFAAAFVVALALTAPVDRWVLDALRDPLAQFGATIDAERIRLAFPAGVRADGVSIEAPGGGVTIDSIYIGLTRAVEAQACGGRLEGRLRDDSATIDLLDVDPSRCLRIGKLVLEGVLAGSIEVNDVDPWNGSLGERPGARVHLTCDGGTVGGSLVGAGQEGGDLPLGEWEFRDLVLRASLADGELLVEEGRANTSGVEWELLEASLTGDGSRDLRVDFRARAVDDSPRARALIGLLPKGRVDRGGWHNFRVAGTLDSPRLLALD